MKVLLTSAAQKKSRKDQQIQHRKQGSAIEKNFTHADETECGNLKFLPQRPSRVSCDTKQHHYC